MQYSIHCFILDASSMDDAINEVKLAWRNIGGSNLYVVSNDKKDIFPKLSECGWLITVMSEY